MIQQPSDLILTHAASPIRMSQFRREFSALYQPPLAARSTWLKYRQVLDQVERLGCASTADLTPELVARFIGSQPAGHSPHTTRSLLMALRAICNYAEGRRYVVISPFRLRKLSRWIRVTPPAGKRHLSREEVRRVLDTMRADVEAKRGWAQWRARRLYALTATVAFTGLRAREAQCLWVADIDLAARSIELVPRGPHLPEAIPAGEAPRFKTEASAAAIGVPAALVPILTDWLAHRLDHPAGWSMPPAERIPWLFPGSRRTSAWVTGTCEERPVGRLKAVGRRAGVEGLTYQALRRTWATVAEGLGVPQALITRQCRHTNDTTTKRWYQQRDLDALRGAVEGFDF